ncbi:MAG: TatD family hydrolase [Clostridia bacterium]|nr:TatD family hydrolase [Clostridia bacterium]
MMLFDSHAHYNDPAYDADRDVILSAMKDGGVGYIINSGCSVASAKDSIALCEKYDFFYSSIGIHPCHAHESTQKDLDDIRALASHPKVKAIGEIGLDYYYEKTHKEVQKQFFADQIELARSLKLPFVIHCRDACGDCLDILRANYKGEGALMHCFSESRETAKILLDMGFLFSIGGTVTFKNNVRTVSAVEYIPLENLVLETDAPYLTPTPYRGKRNNSVYMRYVAEKIAEIKGLETEEVIEKTTENAKRFYRID